MSSLDSPGGSAAFNFAEGRAKRRHYETVKTLGRGAQATVKLARHIPTGAMVAVKTVTKPEGLAARTALSANGPNPYDTALQSVMTEVRVLEEMDSHAAIPNYFDFFETSHKWYIVMEYIAGPDLDLLLKDRDYDTGRGHLSEAEARQVMASLLDILANLHGKGLAHRDLKPANICLRNKSRLSDIVLIDFGASFVSAPGGNGSNSPYITPSNSSSGSSTSTLDAMKTICGTPFFLPPEIVRGERYDAKVDIWSAGCIAFTLLSGSSPFQNSLSFSDLYARILSSEFYFPEDSVVSPEARDFVRRLLDPVPVRRPTAAEALQHPWITNKTTAAFVPLPLPAKQSKTLIAENLEIYEQSGLLVEWDAATQSIKAKGYPAAMIPVPGRI